MNDAEAEEVLLALGPQLAWYKVPWHEEGWQALTGNESHSAYTVLKGVTRKLTISTKKPFFFYSPSPIHNVWFIKNASADYEPPIVFKTESDAKAACQRHYATGQWE